MNVIDIIIGGILVISVIYGVYHGFLQTVLSFAGVVVSGISAFSFAPRVSAFVRAVPQVKETLVTYTDAIARVGDFDLAGTNVANVSQSVVDTVLKSVSLPEPLARLLQDNLSARAFAPSGAATVNEYVTNTIVSTAVDVISFILVFCLSFAAVSLLLSLVRHVVRFPILRQMDWLAGAALGLVRGGAVVYVLMLLLPLAETVVPDKGLEGLLAQSRLLPVFRDLTLFLRVTNGR